MSTVNVNRVVDASGGVLAPISSVMRNRLINGAMVIDQRNAGASVAVLTNGNPSFSVDRFYCQAQGGGGYSIQQVAVAPQGFTNSIVATVTTTDTSVTSTDFYVIKQRIEGFNVADLNWGTANAKTVTLSFWVRSSLTGTFSGSLMNSAENRSYPYTYTISSANTWEQKSVTIVGDTTGTWLTNNGNGMAVSFTLGVGSTYQGTAGSWAGSRFEGATGQTQWISTSGATFYITGVQLEVGSQATSFEYRQYQQELALCQRYYQRQFPIRGGGVCNGTASLSRVKGPLVVTMRASPTAALVGTVDIYDGVVVTTSTSIGNTWMTPDLLECDLNLASALTAGRPGIIYNSTAQNGGTLSTGGITLSAEL
jgi:hypothetical protein